MSIFLKLFSILIDTAEQFSQYFIYFFSPAHLIRLCVITKYFNRTILVMQLVALISTRKLNLEKRTRKLFFANSLGLNSHSGETRRETKKKNAAIEKNVEKFIR